MEGLFKLKFDSARELLKSDEFFKGILDEWAQASDEGVERNYELNRIIDEENNYYSLNVKLSVSQLSDV